MSVSGRAPRGIDPRHPEEHRDDKVGFPAPEEISEQEEREPQAERSLGIRRDALALVRAHSEQPDAERDPRDLDTGRGPEKEKRHARAGDAAPGSEILRTQIGWQK